MTVPRIIQVLGETHPLQVRDQNIFRPVSNRENTKPCIPQTTAWCPPLYRDTSFRSVPSMQSSTDSSFSSKYNDENYNGEASHLPTEFIPPRHHFSPPRSGQESGISRTASKSLPSNFVHLRETDVVCGRGAPTLVHPGNQAYRELIKSHETVYLCAKRSDKPVIAMGIMDTLKKRGIRFVKREREGTGSYWTEISEQRAYEKVCQSLREGAPELRRKMLANNAKKALSEQLVQREKENYSPLPCF